MGAAYFYHLTRRPLEATLPMLLGKAQQAGWRGAGRGPTPARMEWLDEKLWLGPEEGFLPHGLATAPHAARQPILLSDACAAPNEARFLLLADGIWREEANAFARTFLLFGPDQTQAARALWRDLRARAQTEDAVEFGAFRQNEEGGWNPL